MWARRHHAAMNKSPNPNPRSGRQIVGFSLPTDLAQEVKAEAARRNMSLRNLFQEMWALYQKSQPPKAP
jgi:hypothetical protein